jgi:hypothetical protein
MCKKSNSEVCAHIECAATLKETTGNKSASVWGYAFPAEKAKKRLNELWAKRREWVENGRPTDSPGYHDMEGQITALKWVLTG